jgi:cell division septation protein DedD
MSENKQRIVGMVVLAAFIALLIPFLFTGGDKNKRDSFLEKAGEIELQLGENNTSAGAPQDQGIQPLPAQLPSNPDEAQPMTSAVIHQENAILPEAQSNSEDTKIIGEEQTAVPSSSINEIPAESAATKPNAIDDAANETIKVTKKSSAKAASAKTAVAKKKAARRAAAKHAKNDGGSWSVQVGSFSDHDRIQALSDKLQSNGYLVYLQKIETNRGPMTRVLVGSENSREEALQVAKRIKSRLKLSGVVVSNKP